MKRGNRSGLDLGHELPGHFRIDLFQGGADLRGRLAVTTPIIGESKVPVGPLELRIQFHGFLQRGDSFRVFLLSAE